MIILDTNVLYGFFIKEDPLHKQAIEILKKSKNEPMFVIPHVWEELMTLVSIRYSSKNSILFDNALKKSGFDFYDPKVKQNDVWVKFWQKNSPHRMSFTDCVLGYLNQEEGAIVLTFDQELQKYLQ